VEAPLSICPKEEMRGVIRFLFAEGVKPVEIIRRMQAQYDDNCLSRSKIYEWLVTGEKNSPTVAHACRKRRLKWVLPQVGC
jgi:IS30 family transposase